MATVTLLMFSGRVNPRRELAGALAVGLRETIGRVFVAARPRRHEDIGGLGYRGLLVEFRDGEHPPGAGPIGPVVVAGGLVQDVSAHRAAVDADARLEKELLSHFQDDPRLFQLAASRRERDSYKEQRCRATPVRPIEGLSGRPAYSPARWNGAHINDNNCYSYANDRRFTTGVGAHPGRGGGRPVPVEWDECVTVVEALLADGLTRLALADLTTKHLVNRGWPIALFIGMKLGGVYNDYHFYRQDRSGQWSHKPDGFRVRNCDESGRPITDIRSPAFDHLDYEYCGVFATHRGATIEG